LEVATHEGLLIVTGIARPEPEGIVYIHKGIAGRAMERRFQLADFIKVTGALFEDGLLHIQLTQEIPENLKMHSIKIKTKGDVRGHLLK